MRSGDYLFELTRELTELEGPVGHEGPIADWLEARWAYSCERVWRTPLGNVAARLGGRGPRMLLTAHMDEINFIVEHVDERGFAWLTSSHPGSRADHLRECVNREAVVKTPRGDVEAIFASLTGHLRSGTEADGRPPGLDDVFLDFGLPDREAVLATGVRTGCPVLYRARTRRLGDFWAMKAADDRIALAVMTAFAEAVERARLSWEVTLVATVQEEAGAVGAASIRADLGMFEAAIAYDVAPSGDLGVATEHGREVRLGGGPVLIHKDYGAHYDLTLIERLDALGSATGSVQHAVTPAGGTDGIALIQQGIPTAFVGIPTRYTHSPHELVDERDVVACIDLTTAICTGAAGPEPAAGA